MSHKLLTEFNQSYFDHSQKFRINYFRACMQNILLFLIIYRAKCPIFWSFIENLRNNYEITEKN